MTDPHPQRCAHECVCESYLDYQSDDLDPCLAKKCEHDTRTHTPAAPATLCDDCNVLELEEKVMHLEQQVKDEREQVLDAVIGEMYALSETMMDEGGQCYCVVQVHDLEQRLEPLRGGATQQGGERR